MVYIQRRGKGYLETVDEFTTRKEARAMLADTACAIHPQNTTYLRALAVHGVNHENN